MASRLILGKHAYLSALSKSQKRTSLEKQDCYWQVFSKMGMESWLQCQV